MFKHLICAFCSLVFASLAIAQDHPTVSTTLGPVRGAVEDKVHVFRGIPFAAPPVGDLRWRPAQEAVPWTDVRDAAQFAGVCPQALRPGYNATLDQRPMSEDCLHLNVWTTDVTPQTPKAVMVWVLPGGFTAGDGGMPVYNGHALAQEDVVVVTFNYRLGYLGQFAHPALSKEEPGNAIANYYLSDQVAALEWVRDNIANFGGDPDNVTIFGMSAGGVSVNYLMGLPASKGLFHKAISQSSNIRPDRPKHISQDQHMSPSLETNGKAMAEALDVAGSTNEEIVAALRALSWQEILTYQNETAFGSLNPALDGTYLPESLGPVFRNGRQHPVPYLTGATSWEGSLLARLDDSIADMLLAAFQISREDIDDLYDGVDNRGIMNNMQFDTFFGSQRWFARQHAKANLPTYLYRFDYVYQTERGTIPGARHGEETPYAFKTLGHRVPVDLSGEDWDMSDLVSAYWLAFAKTGNPNGDQRPNWPRHTTNRDVLLNFSADGVSAKTDFEKKRMTFFETLYDSGGM